MQDPSKSIIHFKKVSVDMDAIKKLAFQIGTVTKVNTMEKARKPSYEMDAIFVKETKKSCGQFVRNYTSNELLNKQILGLVNMAPVRIAGIKSEYLTLGFADDQNDGQAIPLTPCHAVKNGVYILFPGEEKKENTTQIAEYKDFESIEILSATIVNVLTSTKKASLINFLIVDFGNERKDVAIVPGGQLVGDLDQYINIQVPIITNVDISSVDDGFGFKFMALTLPVDKHDDKEMVTLVKIDKPVKNGLNLF